MFRILDLFCCAGGSSMGYHQAAEELHIEHFITGIDHKSMLHYPFKFIKAEAIKYLKEHGAEYDFIHASPPCQGYSKTNNIHSKDYPKLIEEVRNLLVAIGKPYVIENVPRSPLLNPIMLCGTYFNLKTYRHRLFESSETLSYPIHTPHRDKAIYESGHGPTKNGFISIFGHGGGKGWKEAGIYYVDYAREAMGTPWMTKAEMSQAIPPAYTKYIGLQIFSTIVGKLNT